MLIGILSDTHDNTAVTAAAVDLLKRRGAEYFLHCGDVGSCLVLDYLAGLPAAFVWGNCDSGRVELQRYAEKLGITCCGAFGDLTLDGKRVALMHGDDYRLKQRLLREQEYDYLCQGHTHVPQDIRVGRIHVINPGALHRARPRTLGLLDTAKGAVEILRVEEDEGLRMSRGMEGEVRRRRSF
ncbi:MAG: metallophosphoesterase [Bacillota bacterium]